MEKTHKGLSAGHLTMMALGTVIGGSFFLGSSVAIHAAGPGVIIAYILGGILVYLILFALSEMTVADPAPGSFRTFASKAFGPGAGFVVGWVYWTGMVLAMSSEATAVSILIRQWFPGVSIALLGSLIIIGVTLLNLLGADKLSKLESGLASIKLFAIVAFIIIGLLLAIGLMPGSPRVGAGEVATETLLPGGIGGIAGSMLIVLFAYAGFEVIGLAASETSNPQKVVPRAISQTVISLVALYIISAVVLLLLIPTTVLNENVSPMVAALDRWGITWAGDVLNLVLITAILSTMLAAMFGLGRMIRSIADEGHAPKALKDTTDVPYRGILISGLAMLIGLGFGLLFPRVYLFLISSGGFALLFTYAVIVATHIKFRSKYGCPPNGKCQMPGYPYTSWIALFSLIAAILCMPLIPGQTSGLIAGLIFVAFYSVVYIAIENLKKIGKQISKEHLIDNRGRRAGVSVEFAEELRPDSHEDKVKHNNHKKAGHKKKKNKNKG